MYQRTRSPFIKAIILFVEDTSSSDSITSTFTAQIVTTMASASPTATVPPSTSTTPLKRKLIYIATEQTSDQPNRTPITVKSIEASPPLADMLRRDSAQSPPSSRTGVVVVTKSCLWYQPTDTYIDVTMQCDDHIPRKPKNMPEPCIKMKILSLGSNLHECSAVLSTAAKQWMDRAQYTSSMTLVEPLNRHTDRSSVQMIDKRTSLDKWHYTWLELWILCVDESKEGFKINANVVFKHLRENKFGGQIWGNWQDPSRAGQSVWHGEGYEGDLEWLHQSMDHDWDLVVEKARREGRLDYRGNSVQKDGTHLDEEVMSVDMNDLGGDLVDDRHA